MSFLFKNSKKLFAGNNQKIIEGNKNRNFNQKIISYSKKSNDIDLSKLYRNLKDYYIFSPRFNTLKNSRNQIFIILDIIYII